MGEYQDALNRARRLSVAREAALAGHESAMNVVTLDDLLIYTRSLICQLHSVKKIHAFLKVKIHNGLNLRWRLTVKPSYH